MQRDPVLPGAVADRVTCSWSRGAFSSPAKEDQQLQGHQSQLPLEITEGSKDTFTTATPAMQPAGAQPPFMSKQCAAPQPQVKYPLADQCKGLFPLEM